MSDDGDLILSEQASFALTFEDRKNMVISALPTRKETPRNCQDS